MSKRFVTILLTGLLVIVALTACGATPTPEPKAKPVSETQMAPSTVGLITGVGGVEEAFYSAQAWKGVLETKNLFTIKASYKESASESDYANILNAFAAKGTDLTIATGKEMSQALAETAQSNPNANFAIVDAESNAPNVRGITFDITSPSYIAGYLAGGMSQTGVLCTYGESDETAVTDFMTGFFNGADYYRRQNGVNLKILGWDVYTKEGVFLNDKTSEDEGYQIAKTFFDQDCDIIFAAAKEAAKGSAKAAQEEGKLFIGATVDWYNAFPEYGNIVLTSVMKNTDKAVFDTIVAFAAGSFKGDENYMGTLENNGAGLAPYHQFADKVPQKLQEELKQVQDNILTGHLRPAEPWIYDEKNPPTAEEGEKE